ncbi:Maltase 2 [Cryptotermes secundus]|uniref:alpha-glucosidase n=1 Tax=Cryptotermes secundus TaxID=105785 RepID=A0A2J7Q216_9NEOP|nr:maltase 2 [Cryptotermes secundus]PNF22635.1 Maltase 2 [Cryptotermes secundus]
MKGIWVVVALTLEVALAAIPEETLDWWQTSVFYQVYPRSFKDSDGDGIGDLNGIADKLGHLKDAGIGAVWLSPIYKSPMVDFGYDIANFTDVDPIFGTLEDFNRLQNRAKELGIKLVLDFVPNHSSNESDWFVKSLQRIDPYTEYYVWVDPKYDAEGNRIPPNNWLSEFGGSAWEWRAERQQYYLHAFAVQQADLNYNSPYVVEEMKNVLRFWLDRGVDGFRIDAVPYLFEDPELRDEPLSGKPDALPSESQYLTHIYTQNLPKTYDMIQQWRQLVDEKKAEDGQTRVLMLETYAPIDKVMAYYGSEERPGGHFPFNFLLISDLNKDSNAYAFNETVHKWIDNMPEGRWANWVIGNHDQHRVASRYGPELVDGLNMLAQLLPGSGITYNGEEIGMVDAHISFSDTVDPAGRNAGPERYELFSRDPERTPFQWDDTFNSGFSTSNRTWLPVNSNYHQLNLAAQKEAPVSHYKVYQRLIELRKQPTVQRGSLQTYPASEKVFAFSRVLSGKIPIVVVINLGSETEHVNLDALADIPENLVVDVASIYSSRVAGASVSRSDITLDPKEALVLTSASQI